MANTRSFSVPSSAATATLPFPAASAAPALTPAAGAAGHAPSPNRHRLRSVGRDEVARVVDFLPPGATWLPAPPHSLPSLPGQPPMVGYLVLVPADEAPQPPVAPVPALAAAGPLAESVVTGDALVRIDNARRTAEVDGRELDLTYLEFELLAHLVANPHRVHSRDQLVTTVWGYGHVGDGRTVDVHVARLRRKLGAAHRGAIQTVRRVGYKYAP
ncbi:winged helix-turn-helix domain-containing protein [Streptomyces sp. NPDC089919]|uniref:winged helix-turn-helix domain-containing protein n=1 Tax=Streptomyces sp. NPDC089919 TaxID=3155188 RepID=UPI0034181843